MNNPFGTPSNNNNTQQQSTNPFGTNRANSNINQATPFGRSSNVAASPSVGNTNASFGGNTPFGTSGNTTTNTNTTNNPFGQPNNNNNNQGNSGFGGGGFGTSNNNIAALPFGTGTNQNAAFGTFTSNNNKHNASGTSSGGFGMSSNVVFGTKSSSNQQSTAFGTTGNDNPTSNMSMMNDDSSNPPPFGSSSPFGRPSTADSGSSMSNSSNNGGFGNSSGGGGFAGFGNRTNKNNKNNSAGGFGTTSSTSSVSSSPFGKPNQDRNRNNANNQLSASAAPFTPILERVAEGSRAPGGGDGDSKQEKKEAEEKIARLKAKLAEKKAKLRASKLDVQQSSDAVTAQDQMNDGTTSPVPNNNWGRERGVGRRRYNNNMNSESSSGVSSDIMNSSADAVSAADEQILTVKRSNKSGDLKPSCLTMCPLKEIEKRQECNEISVLEQLHPQVFPSKFTLKDTCVKKFRRSAADVDLSVNDEVRNPVTIERSMAFLEEWIMDRDRQGVDPRSGNVLDSLDVYQFMWDRTRMLRKDLLLQNIPSMTKHSKTTTTLDDLNIAIRVHERITRWHVLCEHQLSHLDDWAQQTSQNVVEMGQCLKSLNMLYDQRRRMVEAGAKSRQKASSSHGCKSAKVHGAPPVDYDGRSLDNSGSRNCIVGNGASDGTIEPEMRGLYILLMFHQNTDFKNFLMTLPYDLHKTVEVKLAIEAVISLRHRDYAKFFKMLRSRCGYIYSCVLFKHVNTMRKTALQIMSKIYGRVPNEYPLERLTRLLCFNDDDETITQLKHYSIPYNENTRKVEFEHSTFSVPDKKIATRKMAVIELKVTRPRLYICRGGCETVMGVKRKLMQIPSSISNATTFQASVQPSAPTTFESFGKVTKQAPAQSLAPTGLSSFSDTKNLSPVPAAFAPSNFSGNSNNIRQAPVPSFASTSQQAMAGLPKKSDTEERRQKTLEDEMIRKQQAFMQEQLEKEAKAEAERKAKMAAERKKEEARRLAKEAEAERQREIRIAEEKRKEKEEEENRIRIKQEKERQRRIELARIEARKAAEAAEAARLAKLKAEAELKARLEAEERKRQAELKAEAERKARMEAERKERERLAELERQRLEKLAAEKRRQQIEIDRAAKAFYIKKWYNHPKLVKLRRKEKTRLSLEKLSSAGIGLYDISDFDATFAGVTATVPSLDTTTLISNFFSHAANTPNLMNIVNLLSDKIASSSIILMKIAIVLPRHHPLNSSIQLWLESRLSLGDVSSIATARFCAAFAVDIDDLAGCDAILFIRPPASLGDSSFDVEIMEYSKSMVNCAIEMHSSDEPLKTAQEDSDLVVDLNRPTEKMTDKVLLRGIYKLIRETKYRALEKVNLASSIRLILQQYMRDHVISISQIDQLFQTLVEELHGSLSKVPDRFADYPAVEFAVDDFVEGYYLCDTNAADLPLNWRIELARSQTKLREALTKSKGLACILRQNRASISVQQQVKFYLSRSENNLATIATIQYLENNNDFVIGLPVGFMNEAIRIVGEKVRHMFVESADPRKNKRDMIPSKERMTQSADRPRLHDTKPAMKPRTLSFGNNEAANTKRPLDLISAIAAKDSGDQIKPDDVLLGFIDIGKRNQRPQSPKRLRAETSPSKSVIRRSKSNSRSKFLQLSESKEYTKRLEAMLSGKSSIDYTVAFLP